MTVKPLCPRGRAVTPNRRCPCGPARRHSHPWTVAIRPYRAGGCTSPTRPTYTETHAMKFSLIYEAQTTDASRKGDHRVFKETVEQALLAEQVGFDTIWCVEHTSLTNYAHMSAPETFLAYLAGRTTRIGLGHGVVCLPPAMNHPIKVAERVALLDILSGGRVRFGVGKGGSQQEAGAFGYDLNELQPMIDESMYLVPKMFVQDEIEHDGQYIRIQKLLRSGAHADADVLNDWARSNMANYKVPRHFTFVERLPMSAAGKVLKYRLRVGAEAAG
ncbi:LLM class flavin-dependent oxidoreductase [Burkholderia ambifaria]|uniref:LLM class flavin-dependent oxidoreductase n=2 Tax=Burkholderia ambifaria TaxID=152480 RepID=UPI003C7B701B